MTSSSLELDLCIDLIPNHVSVADFSALSKKPKVPQKSMENVFGCLFFAVSVCLIGSASTFSGLLLLGIGIVSNSSNLWSKDSIFPMFLVIMKCFVSEIFYHMV